ASKEEVRRAEERHEELPEGSAKNHDGFAEPAEKQVPALVNHQIDVIEKEKSAAVQCSVQEKERIEADPANSSGTRNRLPCTEVSFEQRHKPQSNKGESAAKELGAWPLPKTSCRRCLPARKLMAKLTHSSPRPCGIEVRHVFC